ncbi:Dabb family protein [uncultured Draconibacterium sp.]|uniref:Dabb family protein n=1 Tax=uncultured Draconibacterium sp. TaxID=1573823 RepID=UPI0025F11D3B|nr:Dabb family protein [uncultured Draconibacterium sp.]
MKNVIFWSLLLVAQMSWAQNAEKLMLYRTDFKAISGDNTVSVTSYEKNNKHFVYAGGFNDIDVYELNDAGELTPVSSHEMYKKKGPARGMVADRIKGTDFLFVANKFGDAIEVFKILDSGALQNVFKVFDTEETHIGISITLQVVHMKEASYLFAGGLEETPGLSCFKIHDDGKLTHVQSVKDDEKIHTDGIIGMFTHKIDGKTYLYTGGFQDNGLSSFRVFDNGKFKNLNNISDNTTDRFLTGAYPVTGVKMGENYYVIAGHRHHKYYTRKGFIKKTDFVYHGDAVSVFKVNKKGELVPHSVLKDDESTKLAGQTRIEIVSSGDEETILAVGTRDDASIQLCRLNKDGILSPVSYLETGYSIYYGLRSHKIGNKNFLLAGSNRMDMKRIVAYELKPEELNYSGKVLRHVVSFKLKKDANSKLVKEALAAFENFKNEIPEISRMEWGFNDSTEGLSKGFDCCFTISFNDMHGREKYVFHEAHLLAGKKIVPLLDDVFVMDYWTGN